jgi:signal transduction histidine kinase
MSERSLAEGEHVEIVAERMAAEVRARVDRVAAEQREEARLRAADAASARSRALSLRLALLLVGMAMLLAGTLWFLVIGPLRRLRGAVDRIAGGDLRSPVPTGGAAREIEALSHDVERMRDQLATLTTGLEAEVARKTESLGETLAERTRALEELRATKDRLVQAEKMAGLGTLAGGVAHEFNNLLGGILGCLESARAETRDAGVREDLDVAQRTARRATDLVDALLGVARPGARALAPVDLRAVVADVLGAAAPAAERRRIRVVREDSGEPIALGDEGQLHQVALNLVTNALQAVDDGEGIVVATRVEDRAAVLEVRDEGPGVPPGHRPRLFEPFFTGRPGGTGLGLFVSYGIVERHGGRIEVGDAPEGGARFTVRLPRA